MNLMTDKLAACLYFSSVFLIRYTLAGLTATLGSDSALRGHILCLIILFQHKGLMLQAENTNKISSLGLNIGWSPILGSVQVAAQVYVQFFALY